MRLKLENLLERSDEILFNVRNGCGLNEELFNKFCIDLQDVLNLHDSSESIPTILANITSLTLPLMMSCEGIYRGDELIKLTNANERLLNLLINFYEE